MSKTPTNVMFVGNLDGSVDRKLLYELGCQAGQVLSVTVPAGENGRNKGYAFVEYMDVESATYAIKLFDGLVKLHGRTLRVDYGKATGRFTGAPDSSFLPVIESQAARHLTPCNGLIDASRTQPGNHGSFQHPAAALAGRFESSGPSPLHNVAGHQLPSNGDALWTAEHASAPAQQKATEQTQYLSTPVYTLQPGQQQGFHQFQGEYQ